METRKRMLELEHPFPLTSMNKQHGRNMEIFQLMAKCSYGLEPQLQSILLLFLLPRRWQCGKLKLGHCYLDGHA